LSLLVGLTILSIAFFVVPTRPRALSVPVLRTRAILLALSWRWSVAYVALASVNSVNLLRFWFSTRGSGRRRRTRRNADRLGNRDRHARWFDGSSG